MQTIQLGPLERVRLMEACQQITGQRSVVMILDRIYNKIRWTAEEQPLILTREENGQAYTRWPGGDFGQITVEIEPEEAKSLIKIVEEWPHFNRGDLTWQALLLPELKNAVGISTINFARQA